VDRVGRDPFFVSVRNSVNLSHEQISDEEVGKLPETAPGMKRIVAHFSC
jgi:hypothetical protein